ncbi:MAG: hypothetical protein V1660_00445 [archaeon]
MTEHKENQHHEPPHEEQKKREEVEIKPSKINFWAISTVILAILLIASFMMNGSATGKGITSTEAGTKVLTNVNKYFMQEGSANLSGKTTEESGLYKVGLNINNQEVFVYITKDGKSLVLPNGIVEIAQLEASQPSTDTTNQPVEDQIPKSDKPIVELFVMSFCPYGVKAENTIMPILESLKDKINFKVRFIVNVGGEKIENVDSLHGINEAKEDARQVIIMRDYPTKFYDYLKEIDNNCYSVSSDAAKLDTCWKAAAKKLGMDTAKIETAAYAKEGTDLLKADEVITQQFAISGSPTLMINGAKSSAIYSGTAATQAAICAAFNTAPAECGTAVAAGDSSTVPAGSCA